MLPRVLRHLALASGLVVVAAGAAHAQTVPPPEPTPTESAPPEPAPTEPAPAPEPAPVAAPVAEPAPVDAAVAAPDAAPDDDHGSFRPHIGGYVQPQFRVRQDSSAQGDEDGFRLRRARVTVGATLRKSETDFGVFLETELTPELDLLDAYVSAARALPADVRLTVDLGQVKAPISRQALLSDAFLAFPDKAELAQLAPDRQLGARVAVDVPVAWLRILGGAFNGEGRNLVQNNDQDFLYAGRVEIKPFGRSVPLRESAMAGTFLTLAASVGHNTRTQRDDRVVETGHENVLYLGADIAGAWRGLSGALEYLEVRHDVVGLAQPDFHANGFAAQLNYLVPLPGALRDRIEVGARVEEIDRNDFVPIERPGDANQSLRTETAVVSYYQGGHDLKLQASYSHIEEVEDRDRNNMDATYANDTFLVQASFRME